MNLIEKKVKSKTVFKGVIMDVNVDEISLPNGEKSSREYSVHGGASCIIARLNNGKILMERQFRYPVNKIIYEFPAGKCDKNEDPKLAALRELKEETGYIANRIEFLGNIIPAAAYSNEVLSIYYCDDLVKGETNLDDNEFLEVIELSEEEIEELIRNNEIIDSKTVAGFYQYKLKIKK